MNNDKNRNYKTIAIYAFFLSIAVLLFLFFLLNLDNVFGFSVYLLRTARGVLIGGVLALVLYPLCRFFEKKVFVSKKGPEKHPLAKRALSVSLTFIILLLILAILLVSVLPIVSENYDALRTQFSRYLTDAESLLQNNEFVSTLFSSLTGITKKDVSEMVSDVITRYSSYFQDFAGYLVSTLLAVIYSTSDVLIALILAFYFLLSRDVILAVTRKLFSAFLPTSVLQHTADVATSFYQNTARFLVSRFLCSFSIGIFCYAFGYFMGIPFFPIIALIALILNMVPVLGPIVSIPLTSLIVFILDARVAWFFLLFLLGICLAEHYFLEPRLLTKTLRLSVALVFIVELISYFLFGIVLMIFAVPLFVTLRAEVAAFINGRLEKKKMPVGTAEFISHTGAELYSNKEVENENEEKPKENT